MSKFQRGDRVKVVNSQSDDLPNDWTGIIVRVNPNATYDIFFDQESDRTPPAVNVLESEIERE